MKLTIAHYLFTQEEIHTLRTYQKQQRDGRLRDRFTAFLLLAEGIPIEQVARLFERYGTYAADFAYSLSGVARFRVNVFRHLGGMGAVFEVRHLRLDRPFAMKLIHADQAADPRLMKFFLREARVLSRLRHPGIVEVTDFGSDPHHGFFLVMERLDGETAEVYATLEDLQAVKAWLTLQER